ncbi:ribonucleases P/MRP protein subunit POP1-domain-containing protein [Paraphysoderma sedebokerense]|nr:ribonucleases P/MRP protein subunit POP1-domain-containing protein [Paraphysoderma sedebokerense]
MDKTNLKRQRTETANSSTSVSNRKKARKEKQQIQVQPLVSSENGSNSISIEKFVEARSYEIHAMQKALHTAKELAKSRAFQMLPRHMRRRTASHNPKRVPQRLRDRAVKELEKDPINPKKKPPRNRYKWKTDKNRKQEYLKRQTKVKWLETHIWHAKRFKMIESSGCKIALHSNQKSARSFYRASSHLSTIHDASYETLIELSGSQNNIVAAMKAVTDPLTPGIGSKRYIDGKRTAMLMTYQNGEYPEGMIAPVTCLWKQRAISTDTVEENDARQLWIWIHPSAAAMLLFELEQTITTLELGHLTVKPIENMLKFELGGPRCHALLRSVLKICDDNEQSNSLKPKNPDTSVDVWKKLELLRAPTALPCGMAIALTVYDPRLSFPDKMPPRRTQSSAEDEILLMSFLSQELPSNLAISQVWDEQVRSQIKLARLSEKELNDRRSKNLVPGTKLAPTPRDSKIPILLLQRSPAAIGFDIPSGNKDVVSGWDIILPAGWGMDFWKSFVYAGARAGGVEERHNMYFESGIPCYPFDYPTTPGNTVYTEIVASDAESKWNRTPPAKRINYSKLRVQFPFSPPWEILVKSLFRLVESIKEKNKTQWDKNDQTESIFPWVIHGRLVTRYIQEYLYKEDTANIPYATSTTFDKMCDYVYAKMRLKLFPRPRKDTVPGFSTNTGCIQGVPRQSLPRTTYGMPSVSPSVSSSAIEQPFISQLSPSRLSVTTPPSSPFHSRTSSKSQFDKPPFELALIPIRLILLARGSPKENAMVYFIEDEEEYGKYADMIQKGQKRWREDQALKMMNDSHEPVIESEDDEDQYTDKLGERIEDNEELINIPPQRTVIGYTTSSHYSFSRGKGQCIAYCSLIGLTRALVNSRNRKVKNIVLVRGTSTQIARPALVEFLC